MTPDELAAYLQERYPNMESSNYTLSDAEQIPTQGRGVSKKNLDLFRQVDELMTEQGKKKIEAFRVLLATDKDDFDRRYDSLRKGYDRYCKKKALGLHPSHVHGAKEFVNCLLAKEWKRAAGAFLIAPKELQELLSERYIVRRKD